MFHRWIFLLLLVNWLGYSFAIEDFIKRWRNKLGEPIQYIFASQLGVDNTYHNFSVNSEEMVQCIEEQRLVHGKDDYLSKGITKFETLFKLFGLCFCKFLENSISKCDATIDYSHKDLQSRHYEDLKINQAWGDVKYFDQANLPEQTENLFVKTVTNRGSNDMSSTISLQFDKMETFSSSYANEFGASIGGTAEFKLFGLSTKIEVEVAYEYTATSEQEDEYKNTLVARRKFNIPPQSSRQIICSLKKQNVDLHWEVPIIVTGAVAINSDKSKKGGDWLFVDVKYVAQFFKELSLTRDDPPRLQGFVRGRTRGATHYDAHAYDQPSDMTLAPVQRDLCNPLPSEVKK